MPKKRTYIKGRQFSIYIDAARLEWLQDQVRKGTFKSVCEGIRESVTVMRNLTERLDGEAMRKWVKEQPTQ